MEPLEGRVALGGITNATKANTPSRDLTRKGTPKPAAKAKAKTARPDDTTVKGAENKVDSTKPKKDEIKNLRLNWDQKPNHLGVAGPMQTPKKIFKPYAHTPSRKVMQGGVQKKLNKFGGGKEKAQLETIKDSPSVSPSPIRTEPLDLSPASRPQMNIKTFGSASSHKAMRATPRRVRVVPRKTPLRESKKLSPEPAADKSLEGFFPPSLDGHDAPPEPDWDDEFLNGVLIPTGATPRLQPGRGTPDLDAALAEEIDKAESRRGRKQPLHATFSPASIASDDVVPSERSTPSTDARNLVKAMTATEEDSAAPTKPSPTDVALTVADHREFATEPPADFDEMARQVHGVTSKMASTKHRIVFLEDRLHSLLSGNSTSSLGGYKEVIGLVWQIGSLNRDLDILEMRYNILLGTDSFIEDQMVSSVSRRSSEFAKRINQRFGDGPVRSVSRAGSYKLSSASPELRSPGTIRAAESALTARIEAHTNLLRQKEKELEEAEAQLAALDDEKTRVVSASGPEVEAANPQPYSATEAEMMVNELLQTRLALAASQEKHEILLKASQKPKKKSLGRRLKKALTKPFKSKKKESSQTKTAETETKAAISSPKPTTSYIPVSYNFESPRAATATSPPVYRAGTPALPFPSANDLPPTHTPGGSKVTMC